MSKHIAAIFVITISLMSTTLFAQSSGINDIINRDILELSPRQSPKQEKSSATISIGSGYAGISTNGTRPGGFNIQLDLIFPVTTYLAINGSINYARFPRYNTNDGYYIFYNGAQTNLNLSPGVSFGNFKNSDKFNYFITAGFSLMYESTGMDSIVRISDGQKEIRGNGGIQGGIAILISGRVSYKISNMFQVFFEPSIYTFMSHPESSNYHFNGGVGIAL